ncbi:hypothetical protein MYE70_07170 [Marinobacter alexandrii]|uniref:hypothetical protein n=1 Tax=Marinobacter TaxID=2742 RepID=UPI001FFF9153|nr:MULTISPECIES: hypothetical protein [Marinobacter]MCK2148847.1 hypothetical protein [Marinobacter alexandrii]
MKIASLVLFALVWSGSLVAGGIPADASPGYLNYDYPSESAGGPFSILRTGTITAAGIYEPGYVNYRYPSEDQPMPKLARTGTWLASGVFEPTYVNYRIDRE